MEKLIGSNLDWRVWEMALVNFLPRIILALGTLMLFILLARGAKKISLRFYSKIVKFNLDVAKFIAACIYFLVICLGLFISLEILGLEQILTKLLAGAGVIGIVAGFAFKDIASNAFAGLLLSLERPIRVGDWVELDNAYGTVLEISWLTTAIANITGQKVFVPNQIIYNNTFTNYSVFGTRQVSFTWAVPLQSDLDKIKEIALDEIGKLGLHIPTIRHLFFTQEYRDLYVAFKLASGSDSRSRKIFNRR
ncbi:mechanosensitive ion channel [Pedobacter sp. HDW13]|uniref:mechanosensitive ion channel family protein n=1 Tax=Pedobacter sp. HDW13 TaxID=2714940 RepID=UPI001407F02F|nr:mechanosensitive ion channel domain-containing protein [Pedobacter sp. HDW13]QIL37968.1 mechanosensitive ion channel [Pedobacter sp. HDW13]